MLIIIADKGLHITADNMYPKEPLRTQNKIQSKYNQNECHKLNITQT